MNTLSFPWILLALQPIYALRKIVYNLVIPWVCGELQHTYDIFRKVVDSILQMKKLRWTVIWFSQGKPVSGRHGTGAHISGSSHPLLCSLSLLSGMILGFDLCWDIEPCMMIAVLGSRVNSTTNQLCWLLASPFNVFLRLFLRSFPVKNYNVFIILWLITFKQNNSHIIDIRVLTCNFFLFLNGITGTRGEKESFWLCLF